MMTFEIWLVGASGFISQVCIGFEQHKLQPVFLSDSYWCGQFCTIGNFKQKIDLQLYDEK